MSHVRPKRERVGEIAAKAVVQLLFATGKTFVSGALAVSPKVRVPTPDLSQLRSAQKRQQAVQRHRLEQMTGADLTKLLGLDLLAVERILSEIGLDMTSYC